MRLALRVLVLFAAIFVTAFAGPQTAKAQDAAEAVRAADQRYLAALRANDRKAMGVALAAKFYATGPAGRAYVKAEVMRNLSVLGPGRDDERDVKLQLYGPIATVVGARGNIRFARVWVKRAPGWRLLTLIETPVSQQQAPERPGIKGDCENPCRAFRFTPRNDATDAIAAAWRDIKDAEWRPDPDKLAKGLAEEFTFIGNARVLDRAQSIEITKRRQQEGVGGPGDPVIFMRIHDFSPDAGVMVAQQAPYRGGKPYFSVRVWVKRDGRWQLALSQQTTIQSAPALPAVGARR